MSSFNIDPAEPNPFASPEGVSMPPKPGDDTVLPRQRIDHLEAFTFIFENPSWFVTVLLLTVLQIIPILGPILTMGYGAEMIGKKAIGRTPTYADFDFNRFGEYLMRGLWLFVVTLLGMIPVLPIYMLMFGGVVIAEQVIGEEALLLLLLAYPLMMVVMLLTGIVLQPMILRVGFRNDLGAAFDWPWIRDFIRRMWVDQLLGSIVIFLLGFLVTMAGLLFFCVGAYPAAIIGLLAWWHFLMQLYQVYVHRGGQPIPFVD